VCTLADTPNLEVGRVGEFAEREKKLNYRNVRPYKKQPGQGGEETDISQELVNYLHTE